MICCPTLREADGLAMSSRNVYLSPIERKAAPILYQALNAVSELYQRQSILSRAQVRKTVTEILSREKLVTKIEYISLASPIDMIELEDVTPEVGGVLSAVIRIGNVRLIDNVLIGKANEYILR